MKRYTITEEQLLSVIQLALDLGRGEAPKTGPLTFDWPQRILRQAKQMLEETPDWATHFAQCEQRLVSKGNNFGIVKLEEIPK